MAQVLKSTLQKIENALELPSYNYLVHTAPFTLGESPRFHWHLEIIPRMTRIAGFEWGTGFYINPVAPEEAAEFLRKQT